MGRPIVLKKNLFVHEVEKILPQTNYRAISVSLLVRKSMIKRVEFLLCTLNYQFSRLLLAADN